MQEIRHDGSEKFTNGASEEEIESALTNEGNKSVTLYPPGAEVTRGGRTYVVDQHGSLRRKDRL